MKVKVVAPVEIQELDKEENLDLPDGSRVRDVLIILKMNPARLIPVSVNGKQVSGSHCLKDGDIVVLVFPLSGG
jgi:sulfur carrier protein ThiS